MQEILLRILTVAYACVAIVATLGYVPTIKDLYHHKKASANIYSYVLWSATSGVTFLYSIFILNDTLFRAVSGVNFLACAIVLLLSVRLATRTQPFARPE